MIGFRKILIGVVTTLAVVGFSLSGYAGEEDIKEIKKQIEVLTGEMEKLKLGAVAEPKYESFMGLGPAASKVYGIDKGLSLGGYGEVVYQNYQDSTKKDLIDVSKFVLYTGYKFNDWIVMNGEIEFEHAGFDNALNKDVEVEVEFAYLDFILNPVFNIRTGLMLVPIGIINEYHEPTVYSGVLRPDIETNIIPSVWREVGLMAYGKIGGGLKYDAAIINGLRAEQLRAKDWIRKGRQQGAQANADVLATVVRLTYEPLTDVLIGGSYYHGEVGEGEGGDVVGANEQEGTVNLWEVHARYQLAGLELKGLFVKGSLDGNGALKSSTTAGKEVQGWYAEAAYDIMPVIKSSSEMSLTPFVRYEQYDTNKEVFTGSRDPSLDRTVTSLGLGFKPHPNVIIKADYQWRDTASNLPSGKRTGMDENKIDQFNIGIGFIF